MIVLAGAPFHNDEKKQGEKMRRFFGVFLALFLLAAPALAADGTLLINGTLVTPGRVIQNGWVAIQGGKIAAISDTRPAIPGARTLVTRDIVFPGFVDLHNHPLYAVFPRWHPPKVYANRYEWRADAGYWQAIQTPEGKLVFGIFAALAEFERELVSERTKVGLASARARGRNGGGQYKMTSAKLRLAMAAMGQRETVVNELCKELGVTRQTLYRHIGPDGSLRRDGLKVMAR